MVLKPEKKRGFLSRFFNFRGLAFRSGLYFLLGISLVLIVSFGYLLVYAASMMVREVQADATNITNLTISRIETVIHPIEEVTQTMAQGVFVDGQTYSEVMRMSRAYVKASPVVFGSCMAFEPYVFSKDKYFYAPYYSETKEGYQERILGSKKYNYFELDWYKTRKVRDTAGWSEPYYDKGGGNTLMCTYSVPFYRKKNDEKTFAGVLTMDISLESLDKIVSGVRVFESGFAMLISREGKVLTSPRPELVNSDFRDLAKKILARSRSKITDSLARDSTDGTSDRSAKYRNQHSKENVSENTSGIRFTVNGDTNAIADSILTGKSGFSNAGNILKNGKDGTLYYAPVGNTGWSLVVVYSSDELFSDLIDFLKKLGFVVLASIFAALIITIFVVRKVARPIRKLAFAARQIGQGDFNAMLPIFRSRNEIAQLANSFSAMQVELQNYIRNLQETTTAKEKIESELNVAHDIQLGMLPKVFPTQAECDVYAILKPAKAVGGDLYDFFFPDENHLCFVIGDVSGKSVPASLFMAVTRTLFRAKAVKGEPLNKVMESINQELCKDNPNMMFVTFQAALLDLRNGVVEICNAGHNYPFIQKSDHQISKFRCRPGLPLGVMEDTAYFLETLTLDRGECILMYTDGITEAINLKETFFKEDKLISSMLSLPDGSAKDIAIRLLQDVKNFTEEAEQSDDITLLVVKYRGTKKERPGAEMAELELDNQIDELDKISRQLEELAEKWQLPAKMVMELNLALEECVANIIFHAFPDKNTHPIFLKFIKEESSVRIIITDEGKEFDIVKHPEHTGLDKPVEERKIGGLGIHFIRTVMDKVEYSRKENKNIVILTKKIP